MVMLVLMELSQTYVGLDVKCLLVGLDVKFLLVLSDFSQSWVVTTDVDNSPK